MNRRQSPIAVLLLCSTAAGPAIDAAGLYRYEGGPLLVRLESGHQIAIVVEGEATVSRDRVRIRIDGNEWRSLKLTQERSERRVHGNVEGQALAARCKSVFTRVGALPGPWTLTSCEFVLDGERVGEVQTEVRED